MTRQTAQSTRTGLRPKEPSLDEIARRHSRRLFLRQGGVLVAAVAAANASNYVFHVVMTRLLGPGEYGALGALLAAVLIVSVPAGALQAVVARRAARADPNPDAVGELVRRAARLAGLAGLIVAALLAALTPWASRFINLGSETAWLLIAVFMVPAILGPVGRGALQGTMRFTILGASLVAAAGLKLGLGVLLVEMGFSTTGAVAGAALGETAGLLLVFLPYRRALLGRARAPAGVAGFAGLERETVRTMLALLAYWTLVGIDLVLVRHYQPAVVSGRYAAAALLGRAVLFLPAAVAIVVYPRFSRPGAAASKRPLLIGSLALVGGIGVAVSAGVTLFPNLVARLFGSEYLGTGAVGPTLTLAMAAFGMVNILLYYRLAQGRAPVKTLWAAAALEVGLIVAATPGPAAVATIVLGVGVALAVSMTYEALRAPAPVPSRDDELWRDGEAAVDLTVVTPVYNAAGTIASALTNLNGALRQTGLRFEIVLVSDGSSDGTPDRALSAEADDLRVIHYARNEGKGFALRRGLASARGEFVAFIDADGDLDPGELGRFVEVMRLYEADIVIGSKRHPLSQVSYPFPRRVMSWLYHKLVRIGFGLAVTDTQTGLKLIRRRVLADILPRLLEKRYAFDLELLVAARRLGYRRVVEAPVKLDYQFTSTIATKDVTGILLDTAAIWYRRFVLHHYDAVGAPDQPGPAVADVAGVSLSQ